jgi:hypothetical protein
VSETGGEDEHAHDGANDDEDDVQRWQASGGADAGAVAGAESCSWCRCSRCIACGRARLRSRQGGSVDVEAYENAMN